jgi:hypothetical protein
MPLGTRRRRGRKRKAASEVVEHPSLAALKKNKKNKKKRKGQSSWLTLEFATPHGIGRGRRMWIAWASWQLQASLPIELHIPHSQPLAPITHYQHLVNPLFLLLPSSAMMSNQICSSLGIPSQTDRQTEPLAISLVMLKWVLGMASGMWVLLQHPRTHVFGIPSSSFPIRPSSSSLQTIKPPQQQQNPLPTIQPTKQKENGNNTTTTTSSSNDFWFWSFFLHHNPQTLKHPKHNIDLDLLRIIISLSFPSQSLVPPRLVFNFFFSTLKNQSNSLRISAPKKTETKSDQRIL